jgi:hypothetical protein
MKIERSPTTYLSIEELTQIAAEKFEQAAALAPSKRRTCEVRRKLSQPCGNKGLAMERVASAEVKP